MSWKLCILREWGEKRDLDIYTTFHPGLAAAPRSDYTVVLALHVKQGMVKELI
jgi:hypothetical protein